MDGMSEPDRDLLLEDWDSDEDDFDGEPIDDSDPPDLGNCCCCGVSGTTVRNIMMLNQRGPTPGSGWGCLQCGLPMDGATAVICDACLESEAAILFVCDGYPKDNKRVAVADLAPGLFDHDMSRHPEALYG